MSTENRRHTRVFEQNTALALKQVSPLFVALAGYAGGSQHGKLLAILLKVLLAMGAQVG